MPLSMPNALTLFITQLRETHSASFCHRTYRNEYRIQMTGQDMLEITVQEIDVDGSLKEGVARIPIPLENALTYTEYDFKKFLPRLQNMMRCVRRDVTWRKRECQKGEAVIVSLKENGICFQEPQGDSYLLPLNWNTVFTQLAEVTFCGRSLHFVSPLRE